MLTIDELCYNQKFCIHTWDYSKHPTSCSKCGDLRATSRADSYDEFIWKEFIKSIKFNWLEQDENKYLELYRYKSVYTDWLGKETTTMRIGILVENPLNRPKLQEDEPKVEYLYHYRVFSPRLYVEEGSQIISYPFLEGVNKYGTPEFFDWVRTKSRHLFDKKNQTRKKQKEKAKNKATEEFNVQAHTKIMRAVYNYVLTPFQKEIGLSVRELTYETTSGKDTLDYTGKRLYDSIVNLLGTERTAELLLYSNNSDCKRLYIAWSDDEAAPAIGLIDQNEAVRTIASRKLSKQKEEEEA